MMPTDTGWVFKFLLVVAANNPVRGQEQEIEVTAAPVHRDIRHLSFISLPLSFLSKDPLIGCELRNKKRFISQLAARIIFAHFFAFVSFDFGTDVSRGANIPSL